MNLANKITCSRLALVPLFIMIVTPMPKWLARSNSFFGLINRESIGIATAIFILAVLTDKLDGYVARKLNQVTKLGSFLDPLADKLLIISALMFLVEENKVAGWIALIIIAREIAVTGLRVVALANHRVLSADKYGKLKLVVQAITIPLFLLSGTSTGLRFHFQLSELMLALTVVITVLSGMNYFVRNKEVFYENGRMTH